jgi:hypothetical protein
MTINLSLPTDRTLKWRFALRSEPLTQDTGNLTSEMKYVVIVEEGKNGFGAYADRVEL